MNSMFRKIRREEIREIARTMAEGFGEYPLYDVFFPDPVRRPAGVFYFFWYRIYTRMNFTYISQDGDLVVSIQQPGEKTVSPLGLFLNPAFLFGFLRAVPLRALWYVADFSRMAAKAQKKYYHPETDWYIHAVCVLKASRGNGTFFRFLRNMGEGHPIFCETHTARNVKLYHLLGTDVCEQIPWHGVTHYVMHRDAFPEKGKQKVFTQE